MRLIGKVSSYEKIIAYLKDPEGNADQLTENEQRMLTRRMEAFTLIQGHNYADAAAILMKRFPGISRATAYRDCADAVSMFGDISKATKDGIRHLASEIVRDAISIARLKNNEEGMIKGAKALADINGVNTMDPDMPDFSALEPHTYVLGLPPKFIKVMELMIKGGKIDLTQMVNNMANVADEAEIIEETNGSDTAE
jgi:hypothetical protein